MKKIMLLSAIIFSMSSLPANASGSFSLNFFSSPPLYIPTPTSTYVTYPVSYRYHAPAPSYKIVHHPHHPKPNFYKQQCHKHWKHKHQKEKLYGNEWHDSGDYYRRW